MKDFKYILILLIAFGFKSKGQSLKYHSLDSIFSDLYNTGQFSGSVLIADKGIPVYEKNFGFADLKTNAPINSNTLFLLASVSKQFTAMGIVILKEQGKLDYDDPVLKYLPALPYKAITIRQLLTHTSGIPDYIALMNAYWDKTRYANAADVMEMLIKYHPDPLSMPGTKYEYSNTAYVLLGLVIEKVSGSAYGDFLTENIFKPLGMSRTMVYTRRYKPQQVTNYALGYMYDNESKQFVLPDDYPMTKNMLWEDGVVGEDGINSTIEDMLKWDRALYTDKLVPKGVIGQIFTPGKVEEGETDYGFGWHIKSIGSYGRIAYHSGGWPGYMTYIERHLDNDKTIIILRNKFTPATKMPLDKIREILYSRL